MQRIHDIPGGIHPPQNKIQSLEQPIQAAGLPDQLVLPLSQHIGAPAEPVVAVGERVLKGQLIAKAATFVSAPCHAPTSGHISAIGDHAIPHPSGLSSTCITLLPDGAEQWVEHQGQQNYLQLDKAALLHSIREAGIVGMGGAGFPTPVKLGTDKPIETLIINGTECEPYITADDKLMQERARDVIEGVKILHHLVAPGETLIGIEDNKPDALKIMREAATGSPIKVVSFPTKYPSGGEKQLIQILTGKEVPRGGLPADIGIVLQNIGTAYAVFRAIRHGEPLLSRITTVTGDNVVRPGNYEVLLGTPVQHLLDLCGFDASKSTRLIMGGPMMGFALTSTDIPVVKTTNCILAPSPRELPEPAIPQACIRCGMCAQACPASLLPQQLYWFAQGREYEKLESHNLFDCIECGCCSYVCPSNIPLVQYYRASKATINTRRIEAQNSEQAKIRFEARQQRLEEEQAQKEARRRARSKKASSKKAAPGVKATPTVAVKSNPAQQTAPTVQAKPNKQDEVKAAVAPVQELQVEQDPAQAAIARAQASRANATPTSASEKIAKLEQRLAKAQAKYEQVQQAGGDNLAAFEASVTNLQQKLAAAKTAIPTTTVSTTAVPTTTEPASPEPVSAMQEAAVPATQPPHSNDVPPPARQAD
jgi:electron transport complex protein RnfC